MSPSAVTQPHRDSGCQHTDGTPLVMPMHHVGHMPCQLPIQGTAAGLKSDPGDMENRASPRATSPTSPERVQAILDKIQIGPNLSDKEWAAIVKLIKDFLDIFALTLSEVFPVNFTRHKLNIDPSAVLPKRVHQQPITEPQ